MKKLFILLSSVLVAGCFICHRPGTQTQTDATPEIVAQQITVSEDNVITRYTIQEAANFKFNSKNPLPNGNKVDEIAKDIQEHPDTIVYIVGHTDNIGSEEYNRELSLERAREVAKALAQRGCPAEQIRIHGDGSANPIASNDTVQGRAQNRRVDVVIVKK